MTRQLHPTEDDHDVTRDGVVWGTRELQELTAGFMDAGDAELRDLARRSRRRFLTVRGRRDRIRSDRKRCAR